MEEAKVEAANARIEKPIAKKKKDDKNPFDGSAKSSLTLREKITDASAQVKHYRAEVEKKKSKGNEKAANVAAGKLATAEKEFVDLMHKLEAKNSAKKDAADKKLATAAKKLEDAKTEVIDKALKEKIAGIEKEVTDKAMKKKIAGIEKELSSTKVPATTTSTKQIIESVQDSIPKKGQTTTDHPALDLAINRIKREKEI